MKVTSKLKMVSGNTITFVDYGKNCDAFEGREGEGEKKGKSPRLKLDGTPDKRTDGSSRRHRQEIGRKGGRRKVKKGFAFAPQWARRQAALKGLAKRWGKPDIEQGVKHWKENRKARLEKAKAERHAKWGWTA